MAGIFQEAIAIDIAVAIHPVEGPLDIAPDGSDEWEIGSALVVGGSQHDKKRSGIDAAVVAAEGDFLQRGHLAFSQFVKNLAGLGILLGNNTIGLSLGEETQNAFGQTWFGPQNFIGGKEAVAAKYGIEPGHAGVGVGAFRIAHGHHFEVGLGAKEPVIESG